MNTVLILGAGASKADGAPLQAELFRTYFEHALVTLVPPERELLGRLREYFRDFFYIEPHTDTLSSTIFPTFEEAFGVLDLSLIYNQGFRGWSSQPDNDRIQQARRDLVHLIAITLAHSIGSSAKHHERLVAKLNAMGELRDWAFVSLNYDLLIDNVLTQLFEPKTGGIDLDYHLEFENFQHANDWRRPRADRSVSLFKLHGSLNWLYCPVCNLAYLTPKEKGALRHMYDPSNALCPECMTLREPVIVPPTFFKSLTNPYLSQVWREVERKLRNADRVVFAGYSLPDADAHVRQILKRAQVRLPAKQLVVASYYPKKSKNEMEAEYRRYARFFGVHNLRYLKLSFQQLAEDPGRLDDTSFDWEP